MGFRVRVVQVGLCKERWFETSYSLRRAPDPRHPKKKFAFLYVKTKTLNPAVPRDVFFSRKTCDDEKRASGRVR